MSMIIVNILMITHYLISHLFEVTGEVRNQAREAHLVSKSQPKAAKYLGSRLALVGLSCLIIASPVKRWGRAWKAAVVFGYIVVLIQIPTAAPALDGKNLTITAKLSASTEKAPKDTKVPVMVDESWRGAARRRVTESEEP